MEADELAVIVIFGIGVIFGIAVGLVVALSQIEDDEQTYKIIGTGEIVTCEKHYDKNCGYELSGCNNGKHYDCVSVEIINNCESR